MVGRKSVSASSAPQRIDQRGRLQRCRERRAALGGVSWLSAGSFDDAGEFDAGLYAEGAEDLTQVVVDRVG
jgi:hypothetical protein